MAPSFNLGETLSRAAHTAGGIAKGASAAVESVAKGAANAAEGAGKALPQRRSSDGKTNRKNSKAKNHKADGYRLFPFEPFLFAVDRSEIH